MKFLGVDVSCTDKRVVDLVAANPKIQKKSRKASSLIYLIHQYATTVECRYRRPCLYGTFDGCSVGSWEVSPPVLLHLPAVGNF